MPRDHAAHAVAADNAQTIRAELEALRSRLTDSRVDYREFWNRVRRANALFRNLKPLPPKDREDLWAELGTICEAAKSSHADLYRKYEERKQVSLNKRSLVESKIYEAYHQAKGGRSVSELAKARELLNEALSWMKAGWTGFTPTTQLFTLNDGRMTKEDHDACWAKWQEADAVLKSRRERVGDYNFDHYKNEANDAINFAASDPKQSKDRVKRIQEHMRGLVMTGEQFTEINRLLDQAWQRATHTQSERHGEWRDRQRGYIRSKAELIDRIEGQISHLEGQIDDHREQEQSARTDDFAERVRSWIDQKTEYIREKRRFIRELEDQIRSIEDKLRQ